MSMYDGKVFSNTNFITTFFVEITYNKKWSTSNPSVSFKHPENLKTIIFLIGKYARNFGQIL